MVNGAETLNPGSESRRQNPSLDRQDSLYVNYLAGRGAASKPGRLWGRGRMPAYKAPVEDTLFLLHDVFAIERRNNLPGFADATPDLIEAILGEGAKLCEEVLAPLNRTGDLV